MLPHGNALLVLTSGTGGFSCADSLHTPRTVDEHSHSIADQRCCSMRVDISVP